MLSIFRKELNSFLNSLIAYLVVLIFLVTTGIFLWIFPETNVIDYGYAEMDVFFSTAPYVFLFLVPAITMRSFAEEKRVGTLEILLTKPLTYMDIIGGKYLAAILLVFITLLPTLTFYLSLYRLGQPVGNIDSAGVFGSYIGLFLLGSVFAAIGIFCSSLTDNQIVAFIIAAFLSFVLYYGVGAMANIDIWGKTSLFIKKLGIDHHYTAMSKGLIDSRDLLYFLSVIALFLFGTRNVLARN